MIAPLFRSILKLFNWKLEPKDIPDFKKAVGIFAPHTSNWDFVVMLCAKFAWDIQVRYLGKHTLFKPPFGWFFRAFGGIPVERSAAHNMVEQVTEIMNTEERCLLAIAPEGTRSYTKYWKTGFYHIAHQVNVPIVMFYLDTKTRQIGFTEPFHTTGDIDADFKHFADFYADKTGFIPEFTSIVQTKKSYLAQKKGKMNDA